MYGKLDLVQVSTLLLLVWALDQGVRVLWVRDIGVLQYDYDYYYYDYDYDYYYYSLLLLNSIIIIIIIIIISISIRNETI